MQGLEKHVHEAACMCWQDGPRGDDQRVGDYHSLVWLKISGGCGECSFLISITKGTYYSVDGPAARFSIGWEKVGPLGTT